MNPPYRMPPQPLGAVNIHGDAPIPGAAPIESSSNYLNPTLRTHSSKFPIERELILSSNKNASKIPLMQDSRNSGMQLLNRSSMSVAPELPPKQTQAWNSQIEAIHSTITGTIPRNTVRLPEDVTALAERDNNSKEKETVKKSVTKTYHTLKDLISSKFKKDSNEVCDELNNVSFMQQQYSKEQEEYRSPYMPVPGNARPPQNLNHSQSNTNLWNGRATADSPLYFHKKFLEQTDSYGGESNNIALNGLRQSKAISQPQLNVPSFEHLRNTPQREINEAKGIHQVGNPQIETTDSDDGGFRTPLHRMHHHQQQQQQQQHLQQQQHQLQQQQQKQQQQQQQQHLAAQHQIQQQSPQQQQIQHFQHTPQSQQKILQDYSKNALQMQQQQQQMQNINNIQNQFYRGQTATPVYHTNGKMDPKLDLNKTQEENRANVIQQQHNANVIQQHKSNHSNMQIVQQQNINPNRRTPIPMNATGTNQSDPNAIQQNGNGIDNGESKKQMKPMPGSSTSSDYDKSGNHSSNVDSGRGSAAYSSGRKGMSDASPEAIEIPNKINPKEPEWIDVVDAELRNILEPGVQTMSIRPESTVSGSVSSMSPPLPPLSPDGSVTYNNKSATKSAKQEYGTDTYNRASKNPQPIGPSKGWPSNSIQNYMQNLKMSSGKKQEQTMLKKHLFGLDIDGTSVTNTTRSLDLESLLGGPWGAGQSVSDSETDTQGLRQIRNQLEGLENMYSEVLKMLGTRAPHADISIRSSRRRRHGSLSSLPSSSVSGRPIRDRRRTDERRKVRDIKGINKRFQRLESHVVTLARSVAHLSSEMRSQHLVSQELEELRNDLALLRSQSLNYLPFNKSNAGNIGTNEPLNLTNPKRVKKLTKFFGEDPPLMRLFLKKLGYEKYASLFETERVGMIELPYLGEERLQKLGVPLGPRLRILQEAQISLCRDTTLCIL